MNALRCSRTGILFPDDYVENWGKKYGIGLGPVPVSEALVNLYDGHEASGQGEKKSFPVGVCRAPLSFITVSEATFKENAAIIASDDINMNARAEVMRSRQRAHKRI